MKKQIETRADIELLVDEFYKKVLVDPVIGFIFTDVAKIDMKEHMPIMYRFWETILLDKMTYQGNPMTKHLVLNEKTPLLPEHFQRWHDLFFETVDEYFEGDKAEEAKKPRGIKIGRNNFTKFFILLLVSLLTKFFYLSYFSIERIVILSMIFIISLFFLDVYFVCVIRLF